MKSFNEFLLTEAAINKHMTHLEDGILDLGYDGAIQVERMMEDFFDLFSGETALKNTTTTVKFDGAPAIFVGFNPENGKFFVSSKSLFNANPKINYTDADVDENHKGGLADTLKIALKTLKPLWKKSIPILQGDIMFTKKLVEKTTIDGDKYVTFQPNTLKYAFPADSPDAKEVMKADLGVVFHTTYTGKKLADMSANFGADISKLKTSTKAWVRDAEYDLAGAANFDPKEKGAFGSILKSAKAQLKSLDKKFINDLSKSSQLKIYVQTHFNSRVRKGEAVTNAKAHMKDLMKWLDVKFGKQVDKLKSEKGKAKANAKNAEILKVVNAQKKSLVALFEYQRLIIELKAMLIAKLNQIKGISVFVEKEPGIFSVTNQEGFTAVDKLSGNAVKLVSRLEFSANNFNIPKNWK